MTERTDQAWIRLLKQDDPQAIQDLWILIYQYAINLIKYSRKDRLYASAEDQDDQVREVAVEAYIRLKQKGIYQFRFDGDFQGYCLSIVTKEVYRVGRRYRNMEKQISSATELVEEIVGQDNVDLQPDSNAVLAKIQPCLDELDPRRREIIESLYLQQQRPSQIADRLGLTRNNVNQLASRARRSLQHCLKTLGYQSWQDFA